MATPASVRLACICVLGLCAASAQADAAGDAKRRAALSDTGKVLFKNTKNCCHAFRDLVSFAIVQTKATGEALEDLKFVLVGEALPKRGFLANNPTSGSVAWRRNWIEGCINPIQPFGIVKSEEHLARKNEQSQNLA